MRPLRYSINMSLDGCVDHALDATPEAFQALHRHHTANLERCDALLLGSVTFRMMEEAWRPQAASPLGDWTDAFASTIDAKAKYVASTSLRSVEWNAQLLRGELEESVRALKEHDGSGLLVGGRRLATSLAALGLIDEYEVLVLPCLAGRGPSLLEGAPPVPLRLVEARRLEADVMLLRYAPADAVGEPVA